MGKKWYGSFTIWWNVLMVLIALKTGLPLELSSSTTVGLTTVGNVVIRLFKTNQGIFR